jgi:signal transduction histidine kinase
MFQIKKGISRRFFMALMLIAVIPIGIMGYEAYALAKKALTSSAFLHISTLAKDHAMHLDAWLNERSDDVAVLSRLPAIVEICEAYSSGRETGAPSVKLTEVLRDTLTSTLERSPSYENIYILFPGGEVLASSRPVSGNASGFQSLEVIRRVANSAEPVFGPAFRISDQQWGLHLASKIRGGDGRPLATVLAVLDISRTIDPFMVERIGLGETGETYLVNGDGQIITESLFENGSPQDQPPDTGGTHTALNREGGTAIYRNHLGQEVLGSYLWLPRYEWAILVEIQTDEILRPLSWIKSVGILTALVVTGICLVMAYVVSQRVSRPIIHIANAAQEMAAGRLEQQISFSSKDEVGVLASSFNTMARQLSLLISTLRQKEESLQKAYDELISAQEQLVQSEKMAAIGELVASVAHEMRNPLSSVKLNIQIIERSMDKESMLFEHLQIAVDQVGQLEKMFSDLLNYSKPLLLQESRFQMSEALDCSLRQLEGEIENHGVHILSEIKEGLPPIDADFDKVVQVLVNVLKNALEASEKGGKIEVEMDLVQLRGKPAVAVSITDHGKGILPRNLDNIYRPFFTTKKKGTGLGLPVVKKIMDAHRGEISITSDPELGTTVRLIFGSVGGLS